MSKSFVLSSYHFVCWQQWRGMPHSPGASPVLSAPGYAIQLVTHLHLLHDLSVVNLQVFVISSKLILLPPSVLTKMGEVGSWQLPLAAGMCKRLVGE